LHLLLHGAEMSPKKKKIVLRKLEGKIIFEETKEGLEI
jgi:hypothetical protein